MNYDSFMKEAFELADKMQYEEDLATNVKHNFSPEYEKRMKKIRRMYRYPCSVFLKRSLVFAACFCCCFLLAIFTVSGLGDSIAKWISNVTNEGTSISFEVPEGATVPNSIEKYYKLDSIPDGYRLKYIDDKNLRNFETRYINGEGFELSLFQCCYNGYELGINTEKAVTEEMTIKGKKAFFVSVKNSEIVIWENGEYVFVLSSYGGLSKDEVISLACGVVPYSDGDYTD